MNQYVASEQTDNGIELSRFLIIMVLTNEISLRIICTARNMIIPFKNPRCNNVAAYIYTHKYTYKHDKMYTSERFEAFTNSNEPKITKYYNNIHLI